MKVYISARSNVVDSAGKVAFKGTWMRLARRTVRDAKFRAWSLCYHQDVGQCPPR